MQVTSKSRFPKLKHDEQIDSLPAIQLLGRRFLKDQTTVEYLAEFLLVATSPKSIGVEVFPVVRDISTELTYTPKLGLSLKFFTFFATSKLETRHVGHQETFQHSIDTLKGSINKLGKEDQLYLLRALQGLLAGFAGITQSRTWATQTFMPVCRSLLSREVMWAHGRARKSNTKDWGELSQYFEINKHNFMARGGEVLYLQLLNLFNTEDLLPLKELLSTPAYLHLLSGQQDLKDSLLSTRRSIATGLDKCLDGLEPTLGRIAQFIASSWGSLESSEDNANNRLHGPSTCGWIPTNTITESFLFSWELENTLSAEIDPLEKIEILRVLCSLQVMRTICFRTAAHAKNMKKVGFAGGYCWVPSIDKQLNDEVYKLSCRNYDALENMIRTVMLTPSVFCSHPYGRNKDEVQNSIENSVIQTQGILRKLGKSLGLIVPQSGRNMHFSLPTDIVRTLVVALIPPGKRVSLDVFESRIFHHFGIAVGGKWLAEAANWTLPQSPQKSNWGDLSWFTELLKSGGYLLPLSDAISIVQNPYGNEK
jgi:hypothetical protein